MANPKDIEMLLSITRKRIESNNPNEAMASLLQAIRMTTGEDSIIGIIDQVKLECEQEREKLMYQEAELAMKRLVAEKNIVIEISEYSIT
jgi:hypothetical protein